MPQVSSNEHSDPSNKQAPETQDKKIITDAFMLKEGRLLAERLTQHFPTDAQSLQSLANSTVTFVKNSLDFSLQDTLIERLAARQQRLSHIHGTLGTSPTAKAVSESLSLNAQLLQQLTMPPPEENDWAEGNQQFVATTLECIDALHYAIAASGEPPASDQLHATMTNAHGKVVPLEPSTKDYCNAVLRMFVFCETECELETVYSPLQDFLALAESSVRDRGIARDLLRTTSKLPSSHEQDNSVRDVASEISTLCASTQEIDGLQIKSEIFRTYCQAVATLIQERCAEFIS